MHLRSNPPQKVVQLVLIILSSAMPWWTFEEHGENNGQPGSLRSKMTIVTHLENLPLQKVAGCFFGVGMRSKAWTPSGVQTGNEGEVARMQSKKSDLTNMKVGSYSRRKDALGDLCGNFLVALKWTDTCHMHFFQRHRR